MPSTSYKTEKDANHWAEIAEKSIEKGEFLNAFRSLVDGRFKAVTNGEDTDKIDAALLFLVRHVSPKYSPFPSMSQHLKGTKPAFLDLFIDRADTRLKTILGKNFEKRAPVIDDAAITEIAPTRLHQKILMSRLQQEITLYMAKGAASQAKEILATADGLRKLAALTQELPCLCWSLCMRATALVHLKRLDEAAISARCALKMTAKSFPVRVLYEKTIDMPAPELPGMSAPAIGYSLEHTNFMRGLANHCIGECYRVQGSQKPHDDLKGRSDAELISIDQFREAAVCMKQLPPYPYVYENIADILFDQYSVLLTIRQEGADRPERTPDLKARDSREAKKLLSECWKYRILAGDTNVVANLPRHGPKLMAFWNKKGQADMAVLEKELDDIEGGIRRMDVLRTLVNFSTTTSTTKLVTYRNEYAKLANLNFPTCSICGKETFPFQQVLFLLCGHVVHRDCLFPEKPFDINKAFFSGKLTHCPVCNTAVYFSFSDFHVAPLSNFLS